MDILKKYFKQLGDLISRYTPLVNNSQFVFVPGLTDPCSPHIVPRFVKQISMKHFSSNH